MATLYRRTPSHADALDSDEYEETSEDESDYDFDTHTSTEGKLADIEKFASDVKSKSKEVLSKAQKKAEKSKLSFANTESSIHSVFGGAKKYGNLEQRIKWVIETVLSGIILIFVGIFNTLMWTILKIQEIWYLLYYGLVCTLCLR